MELTVKGRALDNIVAVVLRMFIAVGKLQETLIQERGWGAEGGIFSRQGARDM